MYFINTDNPHVLNKHIKTHRHCFNKQNPQVYSYLKNLKNILLSNTYRNFGNFPNTWVSGKFLKWLGFREIPQISSHLRNFQNLKNIPPSNTYRNLGNFPNAWLSGKFPKCLGIWEISQMPRFLGNFPNAYFKKICKCCRVMKYPKLRYQS